jgi:hypothetical protein
MAIVALKPCAMFFFFLKKANTKVQTQNRLYEVNLFLNNGGDERCNIDIIIRYFDTKQEVWQTSLTFNPRLLKISP